MHGSFGLIVNPIAGLGGPAGLKGSDGRSVQEAARLRGATPTAGARATRMLDVLARSMPGTTVLTAGGPMGEAIVAAAGLRPEVVWSPKHPDTTSEDTAAAASVLVAAGAGLVVFVGGDGTARDVAAGVPAGTLILGVPAGVKMYSSCFAVSSQAAGALVTAWLRGNLPRREAEVLDIDERALRNGHAVARLYAVVSVPEWAGRTQARKAATPASEAAAVASAAAGVRERLEPGVRYLMGPGGTVAEVGRQLGLDLSLLGVDVVQDGHLLVRDASEVELLAQIEGRPARAVVTVIGGQGFLIGRGNQQLSPAVIKSLGPDPLLVVATERKLIELGGRPLLVDSGDTQVDTCLSGHLRVVTGPGRSSMYPVVAPE
jgi:predicted polyphosphate/ATP-dependent NAD kinase